MSFTTRHSPSIIIAASSITGMDGEYLDEEFSPSEDGWDTLTETYIHVVPFLSAEDCETYYPRGTQHSSRTFWIVQSKPMRRASGLWLVEVTYKGWASLKPAKITVGSAAEQQTAENVTITGEGTFDKVQVDQNTPTISVSYLVEDVDFETQIEFVGTEVGLPYGVYITPPANFWTYLTEYVFHFPHGWVLTGSNQDRLPGCNAALVTDTYKYVQEVTPG